MSFNVSYTDLPTFSTNSIGYNINESGTFQIPADNTNVINVCSFDLEIGIYIIAVNIYGLVSSNELNFWYGTLTNSQAVTHYFSYAPQSKYVLNPYYMSSINFTHIINQTQSTTIDVNIKAYDYPNMSSTGNYNCSLVRIA